MRNLPKNPSPADPPLAGFGRFIGRSRYVVLIAVVAALVAFQWSSRRTKEFEKTHRPDVQAPVQSELFEGKEEERAIRPDEIREPVSAPERKA